MQPTRVGTYSVQRTALRSFAAVFAVLASIALPREAWSTESDLPWWVVDGGERRIASVTLPNNVSLVAVRGGKAYGVETGGDGVQRIVRYVVRT